jgi:hypothetical protein
VNWRSRGKQQGDHGSPWRFLHRALSFFKPVVDLKAARRNVTNPQATTRQGAWCPRYALVLRLFLCNPRLYPQKLSPSRMSAEKRKSRVNDSVRLCQQIGQALLLLSVQTPPEPTRRIHVWMCRCAHVHQCLQDKSPEQITDHYSAWNPPRAVTGHVLQRRSVSEHIAQCHKAVRSLCRGNIPFIWCFRHYSPVKPPFIKSRVSFTR